MYKNSYTIRQSIGHNKNIINEVLWGFKKKDAMIVNTYCYTLYGVCMYLTKFFLGEITLKSVL